MRGKSLEILFVVLCIGLAAILALCADLSIRMRKDVIDLEKYLRRLEEEHKAGGVETLYR